MASSSSSSSRIKRYHVFPSFHGPDVRKGFLSHLHNHFATKGITTFKDQEIERGHTIGSELIQAIGESRVSIVVLSKNYASSSWCLGELVEILKCKEDHEQIVMTIFYQVDPSDVRKQSGDFGRSFEKTCQGKTEEVKQRWSKALAYVATIAGEHSLNWVNEAEMIQKIATDVSKILNVTPSRDFDGMVGMEAHLRKVSSLLCLESDEVKMIGIWGPAGIGKTTIARALFNQLSGEFRLRCLMGNLRGCNKSITGIDDYDSKLSLQSQLLSKVLNQKDMRIHHFGAVKEWLHDQRVLVILDDVDDKEQLELLANETSWFGPGSRIIVTTKDKKILKAHGINDIYHVDFPSDAEAIEILCLSAFKRSSPRDGFEELAKKVVRFCGNLPLGLRVVGSSLCGESKDEWMLQLHGLETNLDRKIEDVLRVGYDKLLAKHQSLFLHIACFFNYENVDYVTTMLPDSILDVRNGLNTLAVKSLVHISNDGLVVMHCLLQKLGRQVVVQESREPGKRQFLVEAEEIRDVLANETGTGSVIGISADMSKIGKFSISGRAFEGMRNLKYLRFKYGDVTLLDDIEYLPRMMLLHWTAYPGKCLPRTFQPERLVELDMKCSKLEKLWGGIQPLPNLKKIYMTGSVRLKEIPNLSKATSLKRLTLTSCTSLVELPSSISNLHNLEVLDALRCEKLQVIPTNINLASLEEVDMSDCSQLTSFPDISSNIKTLYIGGSNIKEFPASMVGHCSRLESLDLSNSDIEMVPDSLIGLPRLLDLYVENCKKLVSIQGHSPSLRSLDATNCVSLERVSCSFQNRVTILNFYNCLKLDEEAKREIIQQLVHGFICLPGKEVPAKFSQKATSNSIAISSGNFSASSRFKTCLLLSLVEGFSVPETSCCLISKRVAKINSSRTLTWKPENSFTSLSSLSEHLFIFGDDLFHEQERVDETPNEILFAFGCNGNDDKIMECGVQILPEEGESSSGIEVAYSETGGNIDGGGGGDGDGDGDGDYEAYKVSQVEHIKNSRHTGGHLMRSTKKRLLFSRPHLWRKKRKRLTR